MRVQFDLQRGIAKHIKTRQENTGDVKLPTIQSTAVGTEVSDFTLIDQQNRAIRLSRQRGRVVVIDFIYTRCPLPEVCPRLSANFARLQRRFGRRIPLLSITIDPQFDTPPVLAAYAKIWGADHDNWHFLTGELDEIVKIAGLFGLQYWPEEGSIAHT